MGAHHADLDPRRSHGAGGAQAVDRAKTNVSTYSAVKVFGMCPLV